VTAEDDYSDRWPDERRPVAITVLVADDDPEFQAALAEVIRHEPSLILVGVAGGASEAIALARQLRPDVALVDVKMGEGGGPPLARGGKPRRPATSGGGQGA
jgi:chemotaxis response regulator CheB